MELRGFTDEEAHGYSSVAGILRDQPCERAAMLWDAAAMAATSESEMMRHCLAAGAIRNLPDLLSMAAALGLGLDDTARVLAPRPGRQALTAPYHLAWVTHGGPRHRARKSRTGRGSSATRPTFVAHPATR